MLKMTGTGIIEKFTKLFSQLSNNSADEQKEKIEDMNELMERMDKEEFKSVFTTDLFNRMDQMIEDKILSWENVILILKNTGYWKIMKDASGSCFYHTKLNRRFEKMIIDEYKKKEKDEALLADLCECYSTLEIEISQDLVSVYVPCLVKAGLKKGNDENTQKEVEMALLALSNIWQGTEAGRELFLNEIKEIIKYHQMHHNLTRLAYQSAWKFLINRFFNNKIFKKIIINGLHQARDESLEDAIMNELHFEREARRELEELMKYVDWKGEKEEQRRGKEVKEVLITRRWLHTLGIFFRFFRLRNEEFILPLSSVVQVYRVSRINHREINEQCIYIFKAAADNKDATIDGLFESGVAGFFFGGTSAINNDKQNDMPKFDILLINFKKLKEKNEEEKEEEKRKTIKRKAYEKMEEEGYEDIIISFRGLISFLNEENNIEDLSLNISDYLVNI